MRERCVEGDIVCTLLSPVKPMWRDLFIVLPRGQYLE